VISKIFFSYYRLPKNVLRVIFLEFTLSLIHVAFILILNIYLRKQGFTDPSIASLNSLRFIGALIFSVPLGIYIRGKRLKPFFIFAALIVPLISFLIIESVHNNIMFLIQLGFFLWGIGIMLLRVCSLPFIMRVTTSENSTEALSLSASTWALATIISGLIISGLDWVSIIKIGESFLVFDERLTLWIITILGSPALYFALRIKEASPEQTKENDFFSIRKSYDWGIILKAIAPLVIIAIGAGLTIPFVNLFFNSIFGLSASDYSLLGSATAFLVFIFSLLVPSLRKKYGYWMTIVVVQSIAIICLILMAVMELYSEFPFALTIAIIAYVLRQPLMHMAHPASNELMMNYVGKKNQELISALSSSFWSASWFLSAKIFEWLRLLNYRYYEIFLITAALYVIGVIMFAFLIREFDARKDEIDYVSPNLEKN